jgi:hypothetical protein
MTLMRTDSASDYDDPTLMWNRVLNSPTSWNLSDVTSKWLPELRRGM